MHVRVLAAYPVLQDVLELERFGTKLLLGILWILLVEVENLLRQHPAIMEIAVFGVPDRYYGEVVAAAVQLSEPTPADALRAFCHGKIAGFKHPAKLFQVSEWPMTSSGKIKKRDLQAAVGAGTLQELA